MISSRGERSQGLNIGAWKHTFKDFIQRTSRCPFDKVWLKCIHNTIAYDFMWRFLTDNCRVIYVFGDNTNFFRSIWPAEFTKFIHYFDKSAREKGQSSGQGIENWILSDSSRDAGKIPSRIICVGDVGRVSFSFQLLRSFLNSSLHSLCSLCSFSLLFVSYSILLSTLSCRSPCAKSLSCILPFFEYNLQTPLNARSRFKPPGNRRALLY